MLSGDVVFLLHDTHGFPWDLTQVIARERGFDVDLDRYEQLMDAQRQRGTFGGSGEKAVADLWPTLQQRLGDTAFLGYEGNGHEGEGTVVALVKDGREVPELRAGDRGELLTDRTPFYGESGGQVGDSGRIVGHGGKAEALVLDAKKPVPGLVVHEVQVSSGTLRAGDVVQLSVDGERRNAIRANHSATHLLHRALKIVLGEHVKQAGSVVAPDHLRFDYAHFSPPTTEQLEQVEDLVNGWIRDNAGAETKVMELDEAKKAGAVALFGEKYGDRVRVVSVHPQSTELCGGTHVRRTGDIGLFKITSEGGIASGVRRIVALTGLGAMAWVRDMEHEVRRAAELLRTSPKELARRVEATQKRVKELEKEVETASRRASAASSKDVLSEAREVNGVKVLTQRVDPADAKAYRGARRPAAGTSSAPGVVVVWGEKDGKGLVLVGATKDIVARGFSAAEALRRWRRRPAGQGAENPTWRRPAERTLPVLGRPWRSWSRRSGPEPPQSSTGHGRPTSPPEAPTRAGLLAFTPGVVVIRTRRLGKCANSGHLRASPMSAPTPLRVRLPFRSEDEFVASMAPTWAVTDSFSPRGRRNPSARAPLRSRPRRRHARCSEARAWW